MTRGKHIDHPSLSEPKHHVFKRGGTGSWEGGNEQHRFPWAGKLQDRHASSPTTLSQDERQVSRGVVMLPANPQAPGTNELARLSDALLFRSMEYPFSGFSSGGFGGARRLHVTLGDPWITGETCAFQTCGGRARLLVKPWRMLSMLARSAS